MAAYTHTPELELRELRCSLCGGSGIRELFTSDDYLTGDTFALLRCPTCRLTWTYPFPHPEAMARYYPSSYYVDGTGSREAAGHQEEPVPFDEPEGSGQASLAEGLRAETRGGGLRGVIRSLLFRLRRAQVDRVLQVLAAQRGVPVERLTPGRVLDVGCGKGWILHEFRGRGWEVSGTEMSPDAAGFAVNRLRLPVRCGDLQAQAFPAAHFDVVTLWHVLEHLRDPVETVREAARLLKPGGLLVLAVPNQQGYLARIGRGKWFHLDVPRHLYHYNPTTLRRLVETAGLEARDWRHLSLEYDVGDALQTPLNLLLPRQNLLYHLLRTRSLLRRGGSTWGALLEVGLSLALAPLLLLLSVPWAYFAASRGAGSTVEVFSRKPAAPAGSTD